MYLIHLTEYRIYEYYSSVPIEHLYFFFPLPIRNESLVARHGCWRFMACVHQQRKMAA